jgi:PelA/Pel-15E family pectate lyase
VAKFLLRSVRLLLLTVLASVACAVEAPRPWPPDPFLPVTAGRIAALPAAEQPAWLAYWEKSSALLGQLPPRDPVDRSPNVPLTHAPLGASYSVGLRLDASYTWYANEPARLIADRVVTWQSPAGGWSKDGNYTRDRLPADARRDAWSGGTFDNNATIAEMRYLARVISYDNTVPPARWNTWKDSFLRGLEFVLAAQYPNGGFPQIYPLVGGYHDSITLNDDGYVQILQLLREVGNREPEYAFVPAATAERARRSFQLGLDCILAMQLKSPAGRRTVWCQQYDALTLQPCSARNFEPAAECSRESAGVVKFLLGRPAPTPAMIAAVEGAMQWFADRVIHDKYWDRNAPAGADLEDRPGAPDLWARFYEFDTGQPIFGDRDRRIYYSVAQISFERRKGYTWFCTEPAELAPAYFYWQHKVARTVPPRG